MDIRYFNHLANLMLTSTTHQHHASQMLTLFVQLLSTTLLNAFWCACNNAARKRNPLYTQTFQPNDRCWLKSVSDDQTRMLKKDPWLQQRHQKEWPLHDVLTAGSWYEMGQYRKWQFPRLVNDLEVTVYSEWPAKDDLNFKAWQTILHGGEILIMWKMAVRCFLIGAPKNGCRTPPNFPLYFEHFS